MNDDKHVGMWVAWILLLMFFMILSIAYFERGRNRDALRSQLLICCAQHPDVPGCAHSLKWDKS